MRNILQRTPRPILAGLLVCAALYLVAVNLVSLGQGYSWADMDWDRNGSTSLGEFLSAADTGHREVQRQGKTCTEYFAYKDGMGIKTVCPDQ